MRRLILIVAILAMSAAVTPGLASPASTHKSKTSGHRVLLKIRGASCNVANGVANYTQPRVARCGVLDRPSLLARDRAQPQAQPHRPAMCVTG